MMFSGRNRSSRASRRRRFSASHVCRCRASERRARTSFPIMLATMPRKRACSCRSGPSSAGRSTDKVPTTSVSITIGTHTNAASDASCSSRRWIRFMNRGSSAIRGMRAGSAVCTTRPTMPSPNWYRSSTAQSDSTDCAAATTNSRPLGVSSRIVPRRTARLSFQFGQDRGQQLPLARPHGEQPADGCQRFQLLFVSLHLRAWFSGEIRFHGDESFR